MGILIILFVIGAALLVSTIAIASVEYHPYLILSGGIGFFLVLIAVTYTLKIGVFSRGQPEYDYE